MARNTLLWTVLALAVVAALCTPCGASIVGLRMVGIGDPPDSLDPSHPPPPPPPDLGPCDRVAATQYTTTPSFGRWPLAYLPGRIDTDIDLLFSSTFDLTNKYLTLPEIRSLLYTFDRYHDNIHNLEMGDLGVVLDYLSYTEAYCDTCTEESSFELFGVCGDSVPADERNHVDIYLVKYGVSTGDNPCSITGNPDGDRGDATYGCYTALFKSPMEDPPFHISSDPDSADWHQNSIQITDSRGKCSGDTLWPVHASGGASHEFGHLVWRSNGMTHGRAGVEYPEFNEIFACSGAWLSAPRRGTIGGDTPYGQSLLRMSVPYGGTCSTVIEDPESCPSWAGWDDCRTRYVNWSVFAAYLVKQLDTDDQDYTDDIMYAWARAANGGDSLMNDMCGLAQVLGDSARYTSLGGEDGAERLGIVFNDLAVAKWVDADDYDGAYDFGDEMSPSRDFGLFRKVDTGVLEGWPYNAWELAVPPRFVVAAPGIWQNVPGNASECSTGWNDPADTTYSNNTYCDPVVVRLWGSDYIVFQADTLECQVEDDRYLKVQFAFSGGVKAGTELWLDVLRYGCCPDSLYLRGSQLDTVTTYRLGSGTTAKTVEVHGLGEGGTESVVLVLSLVQTDAEYHETPCGLGCMPRLTSPAVDLTYSYRFKVLDEPVGGGCPFVSSLGASGYASDNNVLAPAWAGGEDVLDTYLLRQRPEAIDGTYRLRLTEAENELSRFDGIGLLAVDHAAGTDVAVFSDGSVGTYKVTGEPVACRDQEGNDVLDLVLRSDGQDATVKAGGWLDVVFRSGGAARSGGGIGEDGGPGQKIEQPGRGDDGNGTLSLASQCYRANPCVSILDMPEGVTPDDGLITLKLTSPTDYKLDRLFMVERSDDPVVVTRCALSEAEHLGSANCMSALAAEDGVYASLAQGDTIDLAFRVPATAGDDREFVLLTRGGEVSRGGDETSEHPEVAAATISPTISPNPFNPSTTISFNVPGTGGRVVVSVYNMAGKLVRRLADTDMQSGQHTLTWDGRGERGESVGSGVYFCRIETPGQSDQKKLVLLK